MKRKSISILLTICMLITMLTVAVTGTSAAAPDNENHDMIEIEEAPVEFLTEPPEDLPDEEPTNPRQGTSGIEDTCDNDDGSFGGTSRNDGGNNRSGALVNNSSIDVNCVVVNNSITLNALGEGGTPDYQYGFYYKPQYSDTWTSVIPGGYSSTDTCQLTLTTVGIYDICIKIKDSVNTIEKKYFLAYAVSAALSASSDLSSGVILSDQNSTNNSVNITSTASDGMYPYEYEFLYKPVNGQWSYIQHYSQTNTATLGNLAEGKYYICCLIKDETGTVVKNYPVLYVVDNALANTSTLSESSAYLYDSIILNGSSTGGMGPYKYSYNYRKITENDWTMIRTFSASTREELIIEEPGTYQVCIKVKDETHTIVKNYYILNVSIQDLENYSYLDSEYMLLGESIELTAAESGGVKPYQYGFYYKKTTTETWSTLQGYSSTASATFTPLEEAEYNICIKVKDSRNVISKKYYTVTVEKPGIYVHFYNYDNWQNVKLYYYDQNGALVTWPGVDMTADGDGWYSYKITDHESVNVVFNDGNSNRIPAVNESEFTLEDEGWFRNGTWTDERPNEIKAFFYKPSAWSDAYIYYFLDSNDEGPAYPGVEMEDVSEELGENWYMYTVTRYAQGKLVFSDGTNTNHTSLTGINASGYVWYKNTYATDMETDADNDGLADYYEMIIGSNYFSSTTDTDQLPDGYEVNTLGTDPKKNDSDNNGTNDNLEDFDNDGLNNLAEYQNGTDPFNDDTDDDGLSDYEEINTYYTDPTLEDTDEDGAKDGWEVAYGYNPLVANQSFTVAKTVIDTSDHLTVALSSTVNGNQASSVDAVFVEETTEINDTIPGYIGKAIELSVNEGEDNISGSLSITFDESLMGDDFEPAIYYYDEENGCLEEMTTTVSGHTAVTTLTHFSKYILLNKTEFEKVWQNDIINSSTYGTGKPLRIVLAVDCSSSMNNNNKFSTAIQCGKKAISLLGTNDCAAIIKFGNSASAQSFQGQYFINDKATLSAKLDTFTANENSTHIYTALSKAYTIITGANNTTYRNVLILITDGKDTNHTTYEQHYAAIVGSLSTNHVEVFSIGIKGNDVSNFDSTIISLVSKNTNGRYYLADIQDGRDSYIELAQSEFDTLTEDMLDVVNDSNQDGISDYYTRKLASGELRCGTGASVFGDSVSYSQLQATDDLDHDNLKNGEEMSICLGYNGEPVVSKHTCPDIPDSDGDHYMDGDDLSPNDPYKNPVILLHGRGDNAENCFGLRNDVYDSDVKVGGEVVDNNSGYNYLSQNYFENIEVQKIHTDSDGNANPAEGSIGSALIENNYTPNGNLFIFNYPNQDMTYINSRYLLRYIDRLKQYTSNHAISVDYNKLYPTEEARDAQRIQFDLIGHSNGGLVARYYIENLGGSNLVRKLVTIDTPHYGAWVAKAGLDSKLFAGVDFVPMNMDLACESRLFTGQLNYFFDGGILTLSEIAAIISTETLKYALIHQSPKLKGNNGIKTKYYAIGGLAYGHDIQSGEIDVQFPGAYQSTELFVGSLAVSAYTQYGINLYDLTSQYGDNVIDIMTQFGVYSNGNNIVEYMNFEKKDVIITFSLLYRLIVVGNNIKVPIWKDELEFLNAMWHNKTLWCSCTSQALINDLRD